MADDEKPTRPISPVCVPLAITVELERPEDVAAFLRACAEALRRPGVRKVTIVIE